MTIPKVVHRLWLGGPEPEWTAGFADTWRQPGWELRQWTEDTVGELFPLINQDIYDRAEEIAPDHVGQLRSDIARYEILLREGGVWVDTDFECLRPEQLGELLDGVECFAAWEEPRRWIANGFMGATPDHPFIRALVEKLPANVENHKGFKPNRLTGPQFLTGQWCTSRGKGVTVFDRDLVYPFGWREAGDYTPGTFDPAERWPKALAVHWWANKRRERNIPTGGAAQCLVP